MSAMNWRNSDFLIIFFLERQGCLILSKIGGSHANEWEMIVIDQKQKLELVIIFVCSVSCLQVGSFLRGELDSKM